jgi:hypothetical protein
MIGAMWYGRWLCICALHCLSLSDLSLWWICRYLAEFKSGAERKEAAESTMNAYKAAQVRYPMKINLILCVHVNGLIIFRVYMLMDWSCICKLVLTVGVALCCRILLLQIWLLPTPSGLVLHLTSQCSTMRFWTPLIVLATSPSRSASAPSTSL